MAEDKIRIKQDETLDIDGIEATSPEFEDKVSVPERKVGEVPIGETEIPPQVTEWQTGSKNSSSSSTVSEELNRSTSHGYEPTPFVHDTERPHTSVGSPLQKPGLDDEEHKQNSGLGPAPSQGYTPNGYNGVDPRRQYDQRDNDSLAGKEGSAPTDEEPSRPKQNTGGEPGTSSPTKDGEPGKKDSLDKKDGLDKKDDSSKASSPQEEQGKHKPGESPRQPAQSGYNPDDNIRRNLQHNNQVQNDAKRGVAGNENNRPKTAPVPRNQNLHSNNPFTNIGNSLRNGLSNGLNKMKNGLSRRNEDPNNPSKPNDSSDISDKISRKLKASIINFVKKHPASLIMVFIIFVVIFSIFAYEASESSRGSTHCRYVLQGVSSTGTVDLDSVQVELVNCDATEGNYTVLETIDFEKYVVGVAIAEVGWRPDYPEYFKTEIIAARNFALTRNSGMCPGHQDDCFYGYNADRGIIRMRACTNDQVYCDIDKPCYHVPRNGNPTLYGPEAEGMSGASVWKAQMSEETKAQVLAVAEEVKGKVLLDQDGNVVKTHYVNTDQLAWMDMAKEGKSYEEILMAHYKDDGAASMNSAVCTTVGNIDYGDYVLNTDDSTILHERLDTFLSSHGSSLDEFNSLIEKNVKKNGYGTKAGVVAAAVTLIGELGNNYGVKIPYYWGGGHYDGVVVGALGKWGSHSTGSDCYIAANGRVYDYCGLDCSGFVPWAIKNGGFDVSRLGAGSFQNLPGAEHVTLNASRAVIEPGDLLESSGHIVLVVGIDEDNKQYICAEASGYDYGVQFTRRPFNNSGYWGVRMDGYYNTHVRS